MVQKQTKEHNIWEQISVIQTTINAQEVSNAFKHWWSTNMMFHF
jgi:hypothetical protein